MSLDEQMRAVIDTAATPIGRNEIGATLAVPQARRRLMPVAAISIGIVAVVALVVTISVREDQGAPFNSSGPTATRPFVPPTTTAPPPIVPPLLVTPEGDEYPIERITAPEVGLGTLVTPLVVDQRSSGSGRPLMRRCSPFAPSLSRATACPTGAAPARWICEWSPPAKIRS